MIVRRARSHCTGTSSPRHDIFKCSAIPDGRTDGLTDGQQKGRQSDGRTDGQLAAHVRSPTCKKVELAAAAAVAVAQRY